MNPGMLSQPEGTSHGGVERNTEDSRGSSTIRQHCLVLKGNSDQ